MTVLGRGSPQLIAGAGGVLLIVSLFLPWASAGGAQRTGWELLTMSDVFLMIVGLLALGTGLTGGRFGVFRPDLSLRAATDGFGVMATILIAWFVIVDFPDGASQEAGVFLALAAAMAVAGGAGDYSTLRGAPLFPRTNADGHAGAQAER